jgi:hypothetical protein
LVQHHFISFIFLTLLSQISLAFFPERVILVEERNAQNSLKKRPLRQQGGDAHDR